MKYAFLVYGLFLWLCNDTGVKFLKERVQTPAFTQRLSEALVLGLLLFCILFRGGKGLEATWVLVGIAWLIIVLDFWRGTWRSIPVLLWGAVLSYILLVSLSYSFSTAQNYGLDEVLRTAALGLLFLWQVRTTSQKGNTLMERICSIIAIGALIACAVGVLVYIFQPVNRFVGTFFDVRFHTHYWPNAWAEFLILAWPMVVYYAYREKKFSLYIKAFLIAFVLGCLVLSYSRGAIISFGAQIFLWSWIALLRNKDRLKIPTILRTTAFTGCIILVIFGAANLVRSQFYPVQSVTEKVTFNADEGKSSISERAQFWAQSLYFIYQRPLLGSGPYSFRFLQPNLQQGVFATSDHPHNVFLKIAMESGVPAVAVFIFIVGFTLVASEITLLFQTPSGKKNKKKAYRLLRFLQYSPEVAQKTVTPSWHSAAHIAIVGVIIHNLIDYNLQFVGIVLPFWLLLGGIVGTLPWKETSMFNKKIAQLSEVLIMSVFLCIAIIEGGFLVLSSVGRHEEARGHTSIALAWYSASQGEWFSRDLHLSRAQLLLEDRQFHEAQKALDDYFEQNREDYRAWKMQGELSLIREEYDDALVAYQRAFEGGKYNDLSITKGLIETLIRLNKEHLIDERRREFDNLFSQFEGAIRRNEHFVALTLNTEDLVDLAEVFAQLYPKDAYFYKALSKRALDHANEERAKIKSSPPGYLW